MPQPLFIAKPPFSSLTLNHMALRVLEQCRVSPPPATGPRPALPLTLFDIPWLDLNPVERIFFYRFPHSPAHFLESQLHNLKSSLSLTLENFYPLAGSIRRSSPSSDRFEIRYWDGDSVSLTVSEYGDIDFNDIAGRHAKAVEKLLPLVPQLPKSPDVQPLLALQVTLFPSKGLCLALKVHHAACDGFSSTHFLKFWAAACRAAGPPPLPPPSFDRSVIADPRGVYSKLAQVVLNMRDRHHHHHLSPPPPSHKVSATFTLSAAQIQKLKQRIQSKAEHSFHCSTFVVSCAYAWVCLVRARRFEASRMAHLFFSVDWRRRMKPPAPAFYFGNCLGCPCFVKATVGEITAEDGVSAACEVIGKAIEELGDDVYEGMEGLFGKLLTVLPQQPVSIAGSPKLRVYETDFGWGKPEKVEVTSIRETGMSMAESRDEEGGVEIGLIIAEDEIEEFGKQFKELL